jgi:hypothetical protein
MSMRIAVVFPAPFAPRNPNTSPGSTWKVIASTAVKLPKRRVRPWAWMAGPVIRKSGLVPLSSRPRAERGGGICSAWLGPLASKIASPPSARGRDDSCAREGCTLGA